MALKKYMVKCASCGKSGGVKCSRSSWPGSAPPSMPGKCPSSSDGKHKPMWEEA